ncbi:MAG: amidoligase family protein [Planctomycetota bacterium]
MFGFEFEFAGANDRITDFERMPFENYERLMRVIVDHYGGEASDIKRVDFTKPTENLEKFPTGERPLFRAEYVDPKGRKWKIEPEFVQSTGLDGYELVTPPLDDPKDLREIIDKIAASGLVKEGLKSGVHLNLDGRNLVRGNDARALVNLILMHESYEPMLRRLFRPVRGGSPTNRFARSIATDHEALLRQLDALPESERTLEKVEELFRAVEPREAALHEAEVRGEGAWTKLWKYRSLNLAKVLQINEMHNGRAGVVEFRMFDLDVFKNPAAHEKQAEIYRSMVRQAELMAERGETFSYRPRIQGPEGSDIAALNTPKDPEAAREAAREMLRTLGLDPANFNEYLERTLVRETVPTRSGLEDALNQLTDKKLVHNGKAFTYGFEYEGRGIDAVKIMVPTDAQVRESWDSKTLEQKKAYYRQTVGDRPSTIDSYFEPDTRLWWLDPYWYTEATGNWEIHSKVFDNLEEAMRAMREAKRLAGASGKGFHLHMRDNGPDWELLEQRGSEFADFLQRASDWVWLQRARRLKTMIGIKSWSNARLTHDAVDGLSRLQSTSRATIRTQINRSQDYIDVEIRGLTKWVDDIELLAKLISNGLVTGNFGEWKHSENPLKSKTKGAESVNFVEFMETYVREVEGKELSPAERRIYERLQHDYLARADSGSRLSVTQLNVATPLQPWHMDQALDPYLRRDLYFRQQDYARSLRYTMNKVMRGEYGVDLDVLSAEGFTNTTGIDPELAEKLVQARELAGGILQIEAAMRMVASGDPAKLARTGAVDVLNGTDAMLGDRLGLSPEDVERLRTHLKAGDAVDALNAAGVDETRILEAIDRSGVLEMNTAEAETLARRLGLTPTELQRFMDYRNAHDLTSEEVLRAAGVSESVVERILEEATRTVDLKTASQAELEGLGLSAQEAAKVAAARNAQFFRTYEDLAKAGLSESAIEALRSSPRINKRKLNTLTAEELVERGGISASDAEKMVRYRSGVQEFTSEVLGDLLGDSQRGREVLARTQPLDLANASVNDFVDRGFERAEAERLLRYARANQVSTPTTAEGWAELFQDLREAKVIRGARRVRELAERAAVESVPLETANVESLQRFGLTEAEAKEVVRLRDVQPLTKESLVEAGFSEAEATRLAKEVEALDLRTASYAELEARTGLTRNQLERAVAVSGTDLDQGARRGSAERFARPRLADRVVLLRDGRSFAEALTELGHGDKLESLQDRAKGVATGPRGRLGLRAGPPPEHQPQHRAEHRALPRRPRPEQRRGAQAGRPVAGRRRAGVRRAGRG